MHRIREEYDKAGRRWRLNGNAHKLRGTLQTYWWVNDVGMVMHAGATIAHIPSRFRSVP